MKKYVVTEWGTLLDFDVDDSSPQIVNSNPTVGSEVLRFNYSKSELFNSETEAWIAFRDKKLLELELEFQNIARAKSRVQDIEDWLEHLKELI